MLVREFRRLILLIVPLLLLFYAAIRCLQVRTPILYPIADWIQRLPSAYRIFGTERGQHILDKQNCLQNANTSNGNNEFSETPPSSGVSSDENISDLFESHYKHTHTKLLSSSTLNKKYFKIKFGNNLAINPNVIPHPLLEGIWIIVANHYDIDNTIPTDFVELACDAAFKEGNTELGCLYPPIPLPIAATGLGKCEGELQYASLNVGPHDARVLYGPRTPFIVYGSNSQVTCFGQWIQDFRVLMNWDTDSNVNDVSLNSEDREKETFFKLGTEIRRPPPYSPMEKNWFLFWDPDGQMYAHYDIAPRRVFAKLSADGSAGPDLAPLAATSDEKCIERHMPKPGPVHESIHQTTNSLSITMCRRSEPNCSPSDTNTFLFTVFQHKTFHNFHSVYEPYALLFRRRAPFEIYGISQKPLWIHGRDSQDQMFYVTSMSWKARDQKYHGYLDDILFLNFGIEDRDTASIDVLAGDLLTDLSLC